MSLEFTGRHRSDQGQDSNTVPLAPLIDMIFILLIFFLVTASFSETSGLDVSKPEATTGSTLDQEYPIITIRSDQSIVIDNERIEPEQIITRLQQLMNRRNSRRVVIAADKDVRTERLVRVIDESKKAGAEQISIATRKTP